MAPSTYKSIKQALGGGLRSFRGQEVEANEPEQRPDRLGWPPGSVQARLVALARTEIDKAVPAFNEITLFGNIFLRYAYLFNYVHGLPLPPLTQQTWRIAFMSVSGLGDSRHGGYNPKQGPFGPFYKQAWLPAWRWKWARRGDYAVVHKRVDWQGLVDRRSLNGILDEHARNTATNAVSLLTFNRGIPRRAGIHLSNYLLVAVLAHDPLAIRSGRIKKSALENFGFKAACVVMSAEQAEGEDDDVFLDRVLRAAVRAKPRGLPLAEDIYIDRLREEIDFILDAFTDDTDQLLPLDEGGKPRHQVAVEKYLAPLCALLLRTPQVDGARSFEILPVHTIEGRAMPVSPSAFKLLVIGSEGTDKKLKALMQEAGVQDIQDIDINRWLFDTVFRRPLKEFFAYAPAYYAWVDLSTVSLLYKRIEGEDSCEHAERYKAYDKKERMLESRRGFFSRAQETLWPQQGGQQGQVQLHRGYDPGQRDMGTTGAVARPGTKGHQRLLDEEGLRTNVSMSRKEYHALLCVPETTEESEAIRDQKPHVMRLEGVLRRHLPTDLPSFMAKMKGEIHLALEANRYRFCRRYFDLQFWRYSLRKRANSLIVTKTAASIPTHVRNPAARVVVRPSGEVVSAQLIMRATEIRFGDAVFPSRGAPTVGNLRCLADNCGSVRMVPERRTSKLCPLCHALLMHPLVRLSDEQRREQGRRRRRKLSKHARGKQYQLLKCPNPHCGTWWQRDAAGGVNIDHVGDMVRSEELHGGPLGPLGLLDKFSPNYKPWLEEEEEEEPPAQQAQQAQQAQHQGQGGQGGQEGAPQQQQQQQAQQAQQQGQGGQEGAPQQQQQ